MTIGGTAAYDHEPDLPPLVQRAVKLARTLGFDCSCLPAQGRLLQLLVSGRRGGRIGEIGTGCGVGLAWMVSAADRDTSLVSVEKDGDRARAVAELFCDLSNVTILEDDWSRLLEHGPFDLLVVDGGGAGKSSDSRLRPKDVLTLGGTIVIDDFSPRDSWPPSHEGSLDEVRVHWLEHPDLFSTEMRLSGDMVTIVGARR
jgi:predicted O-methyltransferase YrrM